MKNENNQHTHRLKQQMNNIKSMLSAYKLEVFKCKLMLLFELIQLEVLKDTDRWLQPKRLKNQCGAIERSKINRKGIGQIQCNELVQLNCLHRAKIFKWTELEWERFSFWQKEEEELHCREFSVQNMPTKWWNSICWTCHERFQLLEMINILFFIMCIMACDCLEILQDCEIGDFQEKNPNETRQNEVTPANQAILKESSICTLTTQKS